MTGPTAGPAAGVPAGEPAREPAADRPAGAPAPPAIAPEDLRLADAPTVRGAVRLLRERTWLLSLGGVLVLSVVFVLLGRWQYHRHEAKVERRDTVAANYDAAPVPLADVLPGPDATLPADRQWVPVRASGTYDTAATRLVRNRPFEGTYGYEVLVPLRLADGTLLVVDRGWIPFGESATAVPTPPAPPSGTVDVVVRLRPGEPPDGRRPPPGQLLRIELDRLDADLGGRVLRAYGVLAQEQPRPDPAPALLGRPDVGLGPHLAYAWNWWGFAVAAYLLLGYYGLREAQLRRFAARGIGAAEVAAARAARRARRRTRVRDEDWEDAAVDGR